MGRPGKVAFLLSLFVLLGTLHGTKAQYDFDYDDFGFDEDDYDYEEEGDGYEGEEEEEHQEEVSGEDREEEGLSSTIPGPRNPEFTPMCNNENCWIRVDWEPSSPTSCILGYRVGYRRPTEPGAHTLVFVSSKETNQHSYITNIYKLLKPTLPLQVFVGLTLRALSSM